MGETELEYMGGRDGIGKSVRDNATTLNSKSDMNVGWPK